MSSDSDDSDKKITPIRPGVKVQAKRKKPRKWKSGADWETLEHYYRVGWTLVDISKLPEAKGVTSQAISNRISRYNWTRNLEPRVADAARAMMAIGGMGDNGKPSPETLALMRGNKRKEDEVVLSSAAQIAERLTKTRNRTKRLDSIIDRVGNLLETEIEWLEQESSSRENPAALRVELNRITKSIGQLVAAVTKANEEERNVHDLRRLMKPKDEVKPLLVKKRAVLDDEDVGPTEIENDSESYG
jgi:hypothetical protein